MKTYIISAEYERNVFAITYTYKYMFIHNYMTLPIVYAD